MAFVAVHRIIEACDFFHSFFFISIFGCGHILVLLVHVLNSPFLDEKKKRNMELRLFHGYLVSAAFISHALYFTYAADESSLSVRRARSQMKSSPCQACMNT